MKLKKYSVNLNNTNEFSDGFRDMVSNTSQFYKVKPETFNFPYFGLVPKQRSFKSSEHINEKGDGPYRLSPPVVS